VTPFPAQSSCETASIGRFAGSKSESWCKFETSTSNVSLPTTCGCGRDESEDTAWQTEVSPVAVAWPNTSTIIIGWFGCQLLLA
jgi:hypothetical protein